MEWISAATTGLLTGAGLIIAIGAQNAFVLAQGLTRRFNVLIALVCSLIDSVLIIVGVLGMGLIISQNRYLMLAATIGGALFLGYYSFLSFRAAFSNEALRVEKRSVASARSAVLTPMAISLLNPHVYLDTVVLLGSIGGRYSMQGKLAFILGASTASFIWFFSLSLGARRLGPLFTSPWAWKILDIFIGFVMAGIAITLLLSL